MKNIKTLLIVLSLCFWSCEKAFLDKEPLDIISDPIVWQDPNLIDAYLADLYFRTDFMELRGNLGEQTSLAMIASMGGEGRSFGAHHQSYQASTNVITSAGVPDELEYWKYNIVRDINYFLEQIQGSPLDQEVVEQKSAEARFLRSYIYFQMVIRYGGVPIITIAQSPDAPKEEIYVSRNSEKEVYDFIISEMESLAQILPPDQGTDGRGKPTKWAAYALQSRAALYAASIAEFGEIQLNGLLGFPSSDVDEYAQISYNASKAILESGFHELYETIADPVKNYQNLFLDESAANREVIMAEVYDYGKNRAHAWSLRAMPHPFNNTWVNQMYLYDFIERFEFADGRPGNSISRNDLVSQEWGVDELWGNRDPRFKASVFYPESPWQGDKVYIHSKTIRNGEELTAGVAEDGWPYKAENRNTLRTGFMVRKRTNENMTPEAGVISDDTDYIIFRVGEIYLNLAEAAFYLNRQDEALNALNRLRERADMPPKTEITMDIIQNERLVELTFENHSYWDIRRWRIAEDVLDGVRMKGLQYTYNYDTKKYQINIINAEGVPRIFQPRNYYLPLGVNRLSENPNLEKNPDY